MSLSRSGGRMSCPRKRRLNGSEEASESSMLRRRTDSRDASVRERRPEGRGMQSSAALERRGVSRWSLVVSSLSSRQMTT
jgi:hypothetical protein